MDIIGQLISEYGTVAIWAVIGFFAAQAKKIFEKYIAEKTKREIAKDSVEAVDQVSKYKDIHGEEKKAIAKQNLIEVLAEKSITISDLQADMLIESAVLQLNSKGKESQK